MTTIAMAPLHDELEMRGDSAIFCRRCVVDVPLNEILDSVAGGRPDDECPRCLTRALAFPEPDGLDID
jgi:hypothetical protein